MNIKKVKFLLSAALLSLSSTSFAENIWINNSTIIRVQALNDGRFIISLPADSGAGCNEGGKLFYVVLGQNGINADGSKVILSLALVAHSSKNKISIKYDNSTSNCYVQQLYLSNTN